MACIAGGECVKMAAEHSGINMVRKTVLIGVLAASLSACASDSGSNVSVEEAARAECERRQTPADQMQACVEEAEDTIREARELQRLRPPPPPAPAPR